MAFQKHEFRLLRRNAGFTQAGLARELEIPVERVWEVEKKVSPSRVEELAFRYVFQRANEPAGPGGRQEFVTSSDTLSEGHNEFSVVPLPGHHSFNRDNFGALFLHYRGVEEVFRQTAADGTVGFTVVVNPGFPETLPHRLNSFWGMYNDPSEIRISLAMEKVPRWESEKLLDDIRNIEAVTDAWIIHDPEGAWICMTANVRSLEEQQRVRAAALEKAARVAIRG